MGGIFSSKKPETPSAPLAQAAPEALGPVGKEALDVAKKGKPVTDTMFGGGLLGGGGKIAGKGDTSASLVRKVLLGQ
jgi:hypothetical protein